MHYTGGSCATRMQRKRRSRKSGKGKGDYEGWTIGELSASILPTSFLLFAFFPPIKNLDNRFGDFLLHRDLYDFPKCQLLSPEGRIISSFSRLRKPKR